MRSEWSDGKAHGDDVGPGSDSRRLIARMSDPEDEDKEFLNRAWWCMAIILVTQEAKAGGSQGRGQPGHLNKTLYQKQRIFAQDKWRRQPGGSKCTGI